LIIIELVMEFFDPSMTFYLIYEHVMDLLVGALFDICRHQLSVPIVVKETENRGDELVECASDSII
jgi:hypothetical protein